MLNKVTYLGNTSLSEKIACNYFNTHSMATWRKWQNWEVLKWTEFMGLFGSLEPEQPIEFGWSGIGKHRPTAPKPFAPWLVQRSLQELTAVSLHSWVWNSANETVAPSYASFIILLSLGRYFCVVSPCSSLISFSFPPPFTHCLIHDLETNSEFPRRRMVNLPGQSCRFNADF